ncbi:MAG: TIGR03862 family flavoprotein [Betaproteobacteria bacterium]
MSVNGSTLDIQARGSAAQDVAVIGGGPAGLMAAQVLTDAGVPVRVFDSMASVGRKFLLAGRGGLNLSHSEPLDRFVGRYGEQATVVGDWLAEFGPEQVVQWAQALGVATFVGSSGRIFPRDLKAAPLLRAWLHQLRRAGLQLSMRHRWPGWSPDGQLLFDTPTGPKPVAASVVVLALGGGSWSRLGSDGLWQPTLAQAGAALKPLVPSNCGFDAAGAQGSGWSEFFRSRYAGQPFKSVALAFTDSRGRSFSRPGEFVATDSGVEGSLIYAASALLRDEIGRQGSATFHLDLLPDRSAQQVLAEVARPRGSRSLASHLKGRLHLTGIKSALLHELLAPGDWQDPLRLAAAIKALPITLRAARPLEEAISSAGGVCLGVGVDGQLRLRARRVPGQTVFCAGEMLDWEAPTGGYLLTACLASGWVAGHSALAQWRANSAGAAPSP